MNSRACDEYLCLATGPVGKSFLLTRFVRQHQGVYYQATRQTEREHTFDSFLSDADVHYSIIRAIADGEHTWSGIANRIGKKGSSISRPLEWLQSMGVVNRVYPLAERQGAAHKSAFYRLADPYLQFWHRFVRPLRAEGIVEFLPPEKLWDQFIEPKLNDYMGAVFEEVCRDFVRSGGERVLPFRAVRVGAWWTSKSDSQIDVTALGPNREVLLGECKWGKATAADMDSLQQRSTQFLGQLGQIGRVHYAIFSGRRPTDRRLLERVESGEVLVVSMEDLFE